MFPILVLVVVTVAINDEGIGPSAQTAMMEEASIGELIADLSSDDMSRIWTAKYALESRQARGEIGRNRGQSLGQSPISVLDSGAAASGGASGSRTGQAAMYVRTSICTPFRAACSA